MAAVGDLVEACINDFVKRFGDLPDLPSSGVRRRQGQDFVILTGNGYAQLYALTVAGPEYIYGWGGPRKKGTR